MIDGREIRKAKERLGDRTAELIVKILGVKHWNSRTKRGCCPFHNDDTPSFVYSSRELKFKCFGCGCAVDIIDAYKKSGLRFRSAVQELFKESTISNHSEIPSLHKPEKCYRYPVAPPSNPKEIVYAYWALRKTSKATIDYADVRQDEHGNTAFLYYDTSEVLKMVKYRPSKRIKNGASKMWCQKGADTTPLLFNMNRTDTTLPLLIVEGEGDALAAIESGYTNVVSVPFGGSSYTFFKTCESYLKQFSKFIIATDADESGHKLKAECIRHLGANNAVPLEMPSGFKDLSEV